MGHPFLYHRAASFDDAARALSAPGVMPIGGGTDLLVFIDEGLAEPDLLVDLRALPGAMDIADSADGSLRIGAAATIAQIADDRRVRERFPVLAEACDAVGTPALRAMGTIGGNLCQRPRCWYFRQGIPCLKSGGTECPARAGENQYLGILDVAPCAAVHPSDPAVALTALEALVEIHSPGGVRTVPVGDFYLGSGKNVLCEHVLHRGEFVSAIILPAGTLARHYFEKVMQRQTWDFALVAVAAVQMEDGDIRVALGGVSGHPWRLSRSVEEDAAAGQLDEDTIEILATRALLDARPLSKNAYKVDIATALVRRALRHLTGSDVAT